MTERICNTRIEICNDGTANIKNMSYIAYLSDQSHRAVFLGIIKYHGPSTMNCITTILVCVEHVG